MTDILTSAKRLAAHIASGRISAREAVDTALDRIAKHNPGLNAVIFLDAAGARAAADRADAALARRHTQGPLFGVPVVMKDLYDFKPGWPTSMGGIPALTKNIARTSCTFVERAEAAGAIILGKGNSPVFGFRGTTDNPAFGATGNPFDIDRNAGGSSGGSAAAVAAGMVPLAEATDGGGSIRIPAAWCNLVGLKPSAGRVPLLMHPNIYANTLPYVTEGVLSRDVADARLGLEILSGPHPADPNSHPLRDAPPVSQPLAGLRVAWCPNSGGWPVEAGIADTLASAMADLAAAGAKVEEVPLPLPAPHDVLTDLWCRLMTPAMRLTLKTLRDGGLDLLDTPHRDTLPPQLLAWVEGVGVGYSADDLYADLSLRTGVHAAFQSLLTRYDIIAAPTVCAGPVANTARGTTVGPARINGVAVDPLIGWCPTILANFTGLPAMSVPAGLSGGLPVGLELTGQRHGDLALLDIAAQIEQIRPWAGHFDRLDPRLDAAAS